MCTNEHSINLKWMIFSSKWATFTDIGENDFNGPFSKSRLKGEYEDYTWGYGQNPLDYPVSWVPI